MGPEWQPVTILGATGSAPPLPGAERPISGPQLWGPTFLIHLFTSAAEKQSGRRQKQRQQQH